MSDAGPDGGTAREGSGDDREAGPEPQQAGEETGTATTECEGGPRSDEPSLDDPRYYRNRELSELAFQRRVLHEALDEQLPLLERVKFLAILSANLDEFAMKRVGGLKQQVEAGVTEPTVDGLAPEVQWRASLEAVQRLQRRQQRCFREEIRPALAAEGIRIVDHDDLAAERQAELRDHFQTSILPTLTPLTFDPAHPFPKISNLSLSLGVLTRDRDAPADADPRFSRVKIPRNRSRFVDLGEDRYLPVEQLIAANLDLLFPNVEILDHACFRVTRNAEVRRNEAVAEDLVERIESVLRERQFSTVVRLQIDADAPEEIRRVLVEELDLTDREVQPLSGFHDARDLFEIAELDRPALSRPAWTPHPHPRLSEGDVFETIAERDVLVHHPYHSFDETVHRFIEAAANDPDVLAIKTAIYRTAEDSQIIERLIEAAHNGKQVAVMVELKARFDEAANLEWVRTLEEEGVHVAYGTLEYKTHTKTTLVVRDEGDEVGLYSHVATGNYHSETAKTYTDLGLLTRDEAVGHDLVELFNYFTGHSPSEAYRSLLIAPQTLRERLLERIEREVAVARDGGDAYVVAKLNRLEDPELVAALYRASRAGVEVDLIVRDICRLQPGIPDVSERISVRSIVGRFLEHSRIYYFHDGGDPEYFVGSADWMTRNLDRRIEAVAPVEDATLRHRLDTILAVNLVDNRRAWELRADGTYERYRPEDAVPVDTHELFQRATETVGQPAGALAILEERTQGEGDLLDAEDLPTLVEQVRERVESDATTAE